MLSRLCRTLELVGDALRGGRYSCEARPRNWSSVGAPGAWSFLADWNPGDAFPSTSLRSAENCTQVQLCKRASRVSINTNQVKMQCRNMQRTSTRNFGTAPMYEAHIDLNLKNMRRLTCIVQEGAKPRGFSVANFNSCP